MSTGARRFRIQASPLVLAVALGLLGPSALLEDEPEAPQEGVAAESPSSPPPESSS